MTYRILLVTTDAGAGGGGFVVECLDRLDDAVTRAQAGGLDIVLIEQSLSSGNALTTLELLSRIAAAVPLMLHRALGDGRDSPTTQALCALVPANRLTGSTPLARPALAGASFPCFWSLPPSCVAHDERQALP